MRSQIISQIPRMSFWSFFGLMMLLLASDAHAGSHAMGGASSGLPAGHPGMGQSETVEGKVLEVIDAGNYTYLQIETSTGQEWAAVPKSKVTVGEKVTVTNGTQMGAFTSPSLGRQFQDIIFGVLLAKPLASSSKGSENLEISHAGPAATEALTAPLKKAEGADAMTIAELHEKKDALGGKTVVIRGKVTKFNDGILNRNWLHIEDGTGSREAGTSDLTITTQQTTEVGEILVVRGTVRLDQDFGAGYRYAVLVEEATLEPTAK